MDQGLVATSNFILNILLARWLIPFEYGAFSVAFTIFLLLSTFHTGMLNEPMLVFGPGKYKNKVSAYLRIVIRGNWIFGIIVGAFFFITYLAFLLFTHSSLTSTFLGLSIASPFILFQWLMRRVCYVRLLPHLAASAGAGYMLLIFSGSFGLYHYGYLNPTTALIVMAIANLSSGLWIYFKLGIHLKQNKDSRVKIDVLRDHWGYGKWASGTAALVWVPGNVFTLFLPIWWGLEASASYKALLNLLLPIIHVTIALGAILLPELVARRDSLDFRRLAAQSQNILILGATVYWLLIGFFGEHIIKILYAGKYLDYSYLLWLSGMIPILGALISISMASLQALELPSLVFRTYMVSSVVAISIGLPFVIVWGVSGALVGWLIAYSVCASMMTFMLSMKLKVGNAT